MVRNVIFLDIDGVMRPMIPFFKMRKKEVDLRVLLSERYHEVAYKSMDEAILRNVYYDFNGEACYCVRMLCQIEKVDIVLSTSWRNVYPLKDMKKLFDLHKLGSYISDVTPCIYNDRKAEIQAYLDAHTNINNYLIIDDIDLRSYFPNHCIVTHDHLKMSQYRDGVNILTGNLK